MGELGSIFDQDPVTGGTGGTTTGDKGPDLRVRATVRQSDLEAGGPMIVPVPDRVPHEGDSVPRHREVGDPPGEVHLHLSPQLVDGTVLRLRRQGGEHPSSGVPGDLLVELTIVPGPTVPKTAIAMAIVAAMIAAAGAAAFAWLR